MLEKAPAHSFDSEGDKQASNEVYKTGHAAGRQKVDKGPLCLYRPCHAIRLMGKAIMLGLVSGKRKQGHQKYRSQIPDRA